MGLCVFVSFPDVIPGGRTFISRDFGLFGYPLGQIGRAFSLQISKSGPERFVRRSSFSATCRARGFHDEQ